MKLSAIFSFLRMKIFQAFIFNDIYLFNFQEMDPWLTHYGACTQGTNSILASNGNLCLKKAFYITGNFTVRNASKLSFNFMIVRFILISNKASAISKFDRRDVTVMSRWRIQSTLMKLLKGCQNAHLSSRFLHLFRKVLLGPKSIFGSKKMSYTFPLQIAPMSVVSKPFYY